MMRFKFLSMTIVTLFLVVHGTQVYGENINEKDQKRLENFFRKRLGARIPSDTNIEVKGYEESPIKGFKKGRFVINSSMGSGEVSFIISQDGKYLVFGEPINTQEFESTPAGKLKRGGISLGGQQVSVLMSKDGKYLILGHLVDSTVDPAKEIMEKISLENVPVRGIKTPRLQ